MKHTAALPVELVECTYEYHFQRMNSRSQAIYLTVLVFIALSFGALFFIRAGVIKKGNGMLTAARERSWVKSPVSGRIAAVFAKENQPVEKGQVLFTMESAILENDLSSLKQRRRAISREIADLRQLLTMCHRRDLSYPVSLVSSLYLQQYHLFKQEVAAASGRLRNAATDYRRNEYLFKDGVLAAAEFDKYKFALEEARNGLRLVFEEQGGRWQAALRERIMKSEELASTERKLSKERELYTVRAPAGGILQQTEGLQPGSFFIPGERVAQLSPDSGLIARILMPPGDIGLVKKGMPVRIQVDAFNCQQWGMLTGKVSDISGDVLLTEGAGPLFEVKCKLEKAALTLQNGYRGELKRGMTCQASFLIAERTLFQLLYDNIADWLDPYEQDKG